MTNKELLAMARAGLLKEVEMKDDSTVSLKTSIPRFGAPLGQQLCDARSWITQDGLHSRFVTEKDFLIQNFEKLPNNVQRWIKMNSVGSEYVFEQVATDLYAFQHGGVGTESNVAEYLLKYFPRTFEQLKKKQLV